MAGNAEGSAPPVPKPVSLFVIRLSSAMKALRLYPSGSDIPRHSAQDALDALRDALDHEEFLELEVGRDGLHYGGVSVFPRSESFATFAREFYKRNLAGVRFQGSATPDEILRFLSLIIAPPEQVAAQGGLETGLAELGVVNIAVTETATRIVDTNIPGIDAWDAGEDMEIDEADAEKTIEELIEEAGADQARDKRLLMRVLRDRRVVAAYLQEARERNPEEGIKDLSERIVTLARTARYELPEERASLLSVIAEAILELQPQDRGELYQDHLLELAKRDEELATVIRELGVEEVVNAILGQIDETPEALSGLSRAVRNLALMNVSSSKETVLNLAVSNMRASGFSESAVEEVAQEAAPRSIVGMAQFRTARPKPLETVLRLVDMTPDGSDVFVFDESVDPLREEAARGTSDGDVIESLVAVATLEKRPEPFSAVMSMLEDSVGYLIESQEADVAADVAEALTAASNDPALPEPHRARMAKVVQSIARPESLANVTSALRRYRPDSPEYAACRRLLAVLGETMIDPLLEVLAEETDMAARKALIELISLSARNYIPELGARLGDRRWYLVRNVVAILATTRSPDALTYLQRTLRHSDTRVRRETIRGLAAIRVAMADSMLAAALEDEDAQNVQLAERYIGSLGCRSAVPALEQVARGVGRGNREPAVRIDAIEALARIGEPSSVAVLQEVARKHGIFGSGKEKDVRAAAAGAVTYLESALRTDKAVRS